MPITDEHGFTRDRTAEQAVPRRRAGIWRGRGTGWRATLVTAVLTASALAAYNLWPPDPAAPDPTTTPPTASAAGGPQAYPAPAAPPSGDCTTWPTPASPGADAAPVTTWTQIGIIPAPSSPTDGPAFTSPIRWCYPHTTAGALYAALNAVAEMHDPAVSLTTVANYLLANDAGRGLYLAKAATVTNTGLTGTPVTWKAFAFNGAAPDAVTVDTASEWNGQLIGVTYRMRWEDGTWKLVMPESLHFDQRALPVIGDGYWTVWGSN